MSLDGFKFIFRASHSVSKWFKKQKIWVKIVVLLVLFFFSMPAYSIPFFVIIGGIWLLNKMSSPRGKDEAKEKPDETHVSLMEKYIAKKEEVIAKRGKSFNVRYITGIPVFKRPGDNYRLHISESGISLKQPLSYEAKLTFDSIVKASAETKTTITRTASMFKGAAGLAIAGPLGAMIGMGIGSKHKDDMSFISIIYKDALGEESLLLLQQQGMFSNRLGNAFEIATEVNEARKRYLLAHGTKEIKGTSQTQALPSNDLSQLEKLAELKEKGIITEEEFIAKKKQLLNI